ncbi:PrpR N-terminal domain-containing protein [Effusibacillus consociatus]|uniref:PrpR N-terminal domain-containing protein n=1 Tax=Effusibacillus consociatus TaxID=1117041 RepID=A0ABV9Q0P2_9BACL
MSKILVIAPYQGLKDLFLEVNEELNKDIYVEVGDLYKGLSIAKSMEGKGYDVIISRGATARLLRENCGIPVVEVKISGYDIMRTLTLVKGYPGKIGLMSYRTIIEGADVIGTLLDMNLTFFPIREDQEVESRIKEVIDQGIQVIIGDVISTSVAARLGLNSILITSGKEAVMESIRDAEHLAFYTKKEKERIQLLEAIISCSRDGIVAVNAAGEIYAFNQKAEELLGINAGQALGKRPEEINPQLQLDSDIEREGQSSDDVVTLNGEKVMISKNPIRSEEQRLGAVAILQTVSKIQKVESQIRNKLAGGGLRARMHFNHLVATSEIMKETIQAAKQYSKNKFPILIYGEAGTGKTSFAQAIHNASDRKEFPFVFLNCESYKEEQLELEIFGYEGNEDNKRGVFELADGGTLFIDAIGKMPLSIQAKLINVLQEKKVVRLNGKKAIPIDVRLIAANAQNLKNHVADGEFREDLFHLINTGSLTIPPLRERKEDIDELVRWFIASLNPALGKQIVGLRPEVMKRLKEANWPGNVMELKNVVRKLCITGKAPFIKLEDVESILDDLFKERIILPAGTGLDISGKTLVQLEKEIITQVLIEEEYNQSKAAKRLGINRSTLWRKIKDME